jgi:hypothetical protein
MASRPVSIRLVSDCWMWCMVIVTTAKSSFAVLEDQNGPSAKYSLRNVAVGPIEAVVRRSENNKSVRRRMLQENDPPVPPLLSDPPPSPTFNTTGTATTRECRVPQVRKNLDVRRTRMLLSLTFARIVSLILCVYQYVPITSLSGTGRHLHGIASRWRKRRGP